MSGRLQMTGSQAGRGINDRQYARELFGDPTMIGKAEKDRSGVAVGLGATAGTAGLVGGGVPIARPDSGRLNQARGGKRTRTEATRHLVSATRGGVFGYRQDAHQRFLNDQQGRLKDWKPHSRVNAFERGREAGKAAPEKKIIRHMGRARVGSNVVAGGGAVLTAGGLHARSRHKKKHVAKAKNDHEFRSDAMIAAGGSGAAASALGARELERQGRKWSDRGRANLDAARKLNPKTGGYDVIQKPRRGPKARGTVARLRSSPTNRVPDVKPHKSTGNLMWNNKEAFNGRSSKATEAVGRLRGAAGQARYFAGVYGKTGAAVRRYGVGGGLTLAAAGAGHRNVEVRRRPVEKAMSEDDAKRLATRYGTKGPLPGKLSRPERMKAYEARYIAAGGPKGEKWQRRTEQADVARNIGVAGATAATAGHLIAGSRRGGKALRKVPGLRRAGSARSQRRMGNVAGVAAVGAGGSELYAQHARSRRASYRNSPAGVARSALTRMQSYTPGGS